MSLILGVDVSQFQGAIDWQKLAGEGVRFAWMRCTVGNERGRDTWFARNVQGAKDAGIFPGAYHFCFPLPHGEGHPAGRDPLTQARRAFAEADQLGRLPGELPPACDIEWPEQWKKGPDGALVNEWNRWGVTAASIAAWTLAFLAEAERLWDQTPILYTYPNFWRDLGAEGKRPAFRRYPLWIANYLHNGPGLPAERQRPIVPPPWDEWAVWQFSGDDGARLNGCSTPIDRNAFRGDEDALRRLVGLVDDAPEGAIIEDDGGDARRDATSEAVVDAARDAVTKRNGG